jgi:ribokinase
MDLVVHSARFAVPGETLLGAVFDSFPGGKGANQAVAIGMLGGNPLFIGKVGSDGHGAELQSSLRSAKVDLGGLLVSDELPTGVALITVTPDGENTILVASGSNMALTPAEAEAAMRRHPAKVLLAQLEVPLDSVMAAAAVHPGLFVLNPAPARSLPPELLARVDVLTPNQSETELLTGIYPEDASTCERACDALHAAGVASVIITLGAMGGYVSTNEGRALVPAFAVNSVDCTGAGDAFSGALAHALSQDVPIMDAAGFAMAVAALSTTKRGAQPSMPSLVEVENLLRSNADRAGAALSPGRPRAR